MLDKLERKFGRYAIKNLMRYIIVLYAIGFFLAIAMPEVYYTYFCLDAKAILHGQVWRIFTFLMNSPNNNPIFVIFRCTCIIFWEVHWKMPGGHSALTFTILPVFWNRSCGLIMVILLQDFPVSGFIWIPITSICRCFWPLPH